MNLTNRLDAVEAALAKKNGEDGIKLVLPLNGETKEEALKRYGLSSSDVVLFLYGGDVDG